MLWPPRLSRGRSGLLTTEYGRGILNFEILPQQSTPLARYSALRIHSLFKTFAISAVIARQAGKRMAISRNRDNNYEFR